jgi:predicted lipoprotein
VKALEKYYAPSSQEATKDLRKKQEEFILACDGDLKEVDLEEEKKKREEEKKEFEKAEKKKKINHRKDEYGNKIKTQMITLEYIRNGKSLKEIANIRELKISTLAGHIEELIEAKSLEKTEIKFLEKDIENILKQKHNEKELETIKKELKKNNFRINKELLANIKFKHKINTDYDTLNLLKIEF